MTTCTQCGDSEGAAEQKAAATRLYTLKGCVATIAAAEARRTRAARANSEPLVVDSAGGDDD